MRNFFVRRRRIARLFMPITVAAAALMIAAPASSSPSTKSIAPNAAIPDRAPEAGAPNGVLEVTMDGPSSGNIVDLNVQLRISHTKDSDLNVYLFHPNGTKITLFEDVGSAGDDFGDGAASCSPSNFTTNDSQSMNVMTALQGAPTKAPFRGDWKPFGNLDSLVGLTRSGIWKLRIEDDDPTNVGTLHCWRLLFDFDSDADTKFDGPFAAGGDNCPYVANATQVNTDNAFTAVTGPPAMPAGDPFGDACDTDDDADGILDVSDNCPLVRNPDQLDSNGNGKGDVCDDDMDNDGIANTTDNCPTTANADQKNFDKLLTGGDNLGDACDDDDDADGLSDAAEASAGSNPLNPDTDADGKKDGSDNCVLVKNIDQKNSDGDAFGDLCDDDDDNDGLTDAEEASLTTNPLVADTDGDGLTDGEEVNAFGTDPKDKDTDGDLHGDATEVNGGSDPRNPLSIMAVNGPVTVTENPPVREMPGTDLLEPVR